MQNNVTTFRIVYLAIMTLISIGLVLKVAAKANMTPPVTAVFLVMVLGSTAFVYYKAHGRR